MTALAQLLQGRGIVVSGSDTHEQFFTDQVLKKLGLKVREGFDQSNVPADADVVVASTAYLADGQRHVEVEEAKRRSLPIVTYPQMLGLLFEDRYGLAVAGTHGKTTTTAMLGFVLEQAGLDPEVLVGSRVIQWQSNARVGRSKYFVVEADEYRGAFLHYRPRGLILTHIEYDHPDYYNNFESYKDAFRRLVRKIPRTGFIVANQADDQVRDVVEDVCCRLVYYTPLDAPLRLPGRHNALNAGAVLAAAGLLGLPEPAVKKSLFNFAGTSRRLEDKGFFNGALLVDDYAHHPTEIRASLAAIRERYPRKKIWAVFQPHTFSRTQALLSEFSCAFGQADQVVVLDIYSSAREQAGQVHARELTASLPQPNTAYIPSVEEAVSWLRPQLGQNDVVLAMGAGDVWRVLDLLQG